MNKGMSDEEIDYFRNILYFDSYGCLRKGAEDVIANINLLNSGIINCFLIDWTHYSDFHTFEEILDRLLIMNIKNDFNKKLKLYPTVYGIFITTYEKWFFESYHEIFLKTSDEYIVSKIDVFMLEKLLTPNDLKHPKNSGNDYILHIEYKKGGSVPFKWGSSYEELERQLCNFNYELGKDYYFSITTREDLDVIGETHCINLDVEAYICKDFDLEKYMDEVSNENRILENNNNLCKKLCSLCQ